MSEEINFDRDYYITQLGLASSKDNDYLLEMMDYYDVYSLRQLTTEQVKDFYKKLRIKRENN